MNGYHFVVQRLFSSFPTGAAGIALVILRLCVAASIVTAIFFRPPTPTALIFACLTAAGLILGAWTPIVSVFAIIALVAFGHAIPSRTVLDILQALALTLLGPGAYSIDAKRFGRRILFISSE